MKSIIGLRGSRLAIAVVTAFAIAGSIAYAAIPDAVTGVYHACMKKNGTIRIIDPAREQCKPSNEVEITFNREGPKGDPGPQGPPGPAGEDGEDGEDGAPFSGTFTSPNGQYSISVTDTGIVLASPDSSIRLLDNAIRVESVGTDLIEVRGHAMTVQSGGALELGSGGAMTVESGGAMTVESSSAMRVESGSGMTVESGSGMTVESGSGMTVESGADLTLRGGSTATLEGGSNVVVNGGLVRLNAPGGCSAAARLGDDVNPAVNKIVSGSPTVCIGG